MSNLVKELQVYNGGHILNEAMVEYRNKQAEQINSIKGVKCYNVLDDKSINDKANATQEGLAERILSNDFKAMQQSDIFVFDILNEGLGTMSELSIVMGMKHQAKKVLDMLTKNNFISKDYNSLELGYLEAYDDCYRDLSYTEKELFDEALITYQKPVLVYCSDIRQGHGKPYNDPDRAEFSTNQFIYGVILELTDGKGFISWDEVIAELSRKGGSLDE